MWNEYYNRRKHKEIKDQKGVTQERLAESIGGTPQAISRWESESGYPAIEYLPDTAWYFLRYMEHERYNPVREEKRFVIIKDKMEKMAK